MKSFLTALWRGSRTVLEYTGNVISTIVLVVFYYTIFAVFAIGWKAFGGTIGDGALRAVPKRRKKPAASPLDAFREEY